MIVAISKITQIVNCNYSFHFVGKKEKDAVKAILQEFNPILRDIYCQTKDGNGQRWLMIDLEDKENMYSDIFRLIDIRRG